jgi:hypothetical protein
MNDTVYIYGICDPRNQELRYVGKALNMKQRILGHKQTALIGHKRYSCRWLKGIYQEGLEPDFFILETCTNDTWAEAERFWISYFKYIGARLTNHREGGNGGKHSMETISLMSTKAKSPTRLARLAKYMQSLSHEEKKLISLKTIATRQKNFTHEEWSAKIKLAKKSTNPSHVDLVCPICNQVYTVHFYDRKRKDTCSPECARILSHRKVDHSARPKSPNGKFLTKRENYTNEQWADKVQEIDSKTKHHPPITLTCSVCNHTFTVKYFNRNKKTCSPECRYKLRFKNRFDS